MGTASAGEPFESCNCFLGLPLGLRQYFCIDFTSCPQTASIFSSVLTVMIFLTHSSLLSVVSYTALSILTTVASIKIYAFVMIKMGKVEQDFDPLANVRLIFLLLLNLNPSFLDI